MTPELQRLKILAQRALGSDAVGSDNVDYAHFR